MDRGRLVHYQSDEYDEHCDRKGRNESIVLLRSMLIDQTPPQIKHVIIAGHHGNNLSKVDFSTFPLLEVLEIGSYCFQYCTRFILNDLRYLRSILIQKECFNKNLKLRKPNQWQHRLQNRQQNGVDDMNDNRNENENHDRILPIEDDLCGCCMIRNCPSLESMRIGSSSFSDYNEMVLEDLVSLQSIEIGENSFGRSKKCVFKSK